MNKKTIALSKKEKETIILWYRIRESEWPANNQDEHDLFKKLTGKKWNKKMRFDGGY